MILNPYRTSIKNPFTFLRSSVCWWIVGCHYNLLLHIQSWSEVVLFSKFQFADIFHVIISESSFSFYMVTLSLQNNTEEYRFKVYGVASWHSVTLLCKDQTHIYSFIHLESLSPRLILSYYLLLFDPLCSFFILYSYNVCCSELFQIKLVLLFAYSVRVYFKASESHYLHHKKILMDLFLMDIRSNLTQYLQSIIAFSLCETEALNLNKNKVHVSNCLINVILKL